MKTISFKLVGVSPLMLNNPRTVSPFDAYSKQISGLTAKRKKTEEDQLEICRLKFLASLYQNSKGEYIIPSSHIMQAVKCAAKEIRLGAKVERSFGVMDDGLLKFKDADKTPEQLYELGIYVDCRAVGIRCAKVLATRAIFPEWSTECTCWYDESQLDRDQIVKLFEVAGLRYHLGTFRAMYGKFEAKVIK